MVGKQCSRAEAQLNEHKVESHVDCEPKRTQRHHVYIGSKSVADQEHYSTVKKPRGKD